MNMRELAVRGISDTLEESAQKGRPSLDEVAGWLP